MPDTHPISPQTTFDDANGNLHRLVRRWAEIAPDEVSLHATEFSGHVWTAKDEHGDADSNLWFYDGLDGWASLLAGVTYHAVRHGFDLVTQTGWRGVAIAWAYRPEEGSGRAEYADPAGGVRAVLLAALTAYLERLGSLNA